MNESQRTMIFGVVAIVSVIVARFAGPSAPKPGGEFTDVGEFFYPDFKDANAAKTLEVGSYIADKGTVRKFAVTQDKDGRWRIPYANNYPADGKDRLAKTASSMIGIKKEGFAGRRESEHAEFGVLDPNSDSITDLKGIGDRITLKDASGNVLADYIIGKEVKGHQGFRYVRRPDQNATYCAKLDIQVSTKFVDWIEADLLKIEATHLNSITIDTTSVVEGDDRKIVEGETSHLTRKASADPWKMDGLDEATEEVNKDEVQKIVSSLDDLKIVGVRRKPPKFAQSLREGEQMQLDQATMIDMDLKGFMLARSRKGIRLIPKDGSLIATTDQGVSYDLKFGSIFNGTEEEVEAGFASDGKESEKKKADDEKKDELAKSVQKSRYLFVMVQFDAEALGPKPIAPEKPEAPAETPAAEAGQDTPADAASPTNTAEDPKKVQEAAMAKYEFDRRKYDADVKAYEEKIKTGEKLVKDLNNRFADWYYVVSGDSFENLRQGRKTLVKEKTAADPAKKDASANPAAESTKEE